MSIPTGILYGWLKKEITNIGDTVDSDINIVWEDRLTTVYNKGND